MCDLCCWTDRLRSFESVAANSDQPEFKPGAAADSFTSSVSKPYIASRVTYTCGHAVTRFNSYPVSYDYAYPCPKCDPYAY